MTGLLGREAGDGPTVSLGTYRARDGSEGAPVELDCDRPHAGLVVGKRGSGKSHTLGVVAEGLARASGVAPVVVDPMGVFEGLAAPADGDPVPATVVSDPAVAATALGPAAWCALFDLSPTSASGSLVWRAATAADTLAGMRSHVAESDATRAARRAAGNHLDLAARWGVFDPDGLAASTLATDAATVLDCSGLGAAPTNAVVAGAARALYDARVENRIRRLPWLLVDEAHVVLDGAAAPALRTLLSRGRAPGVSLVAATQRPAALPPVAVSQADVVVAHRLTARADREAFAAVRPTGRDHPLGTRPPDRPGAATVLDDVTESVDRVQVRDRATPHGGASPSASRLSGPDR